MHVYSLLQQELQPLSFGMAVGAGGPCLLIIQSFFGNNHPATAC